MKTNFNINNSAVILSILDRIIRSEQGQIYCFHFKGYWKGYKVEELNFFSNALPILLMKESYLLFVTDLQFSDGILRGRLIKYDQVFK